MKTFTTLLSALALVSTPVWAGEQGTANAPAPSSLLPTVTIASNIYGDHSFGVGGVGGTLGGSLLAVYSGGATGGSLLAVTVDGPESATELLPDN